MRIGFTFLSFLLLQGIFGQKITGRIVDSENQAAEFANVLLLAQQDSSLVRGAVATVDGTFEIEGLIPSGSYYLSASLMGNEVYWSPVINYVGQNIDAGAIILKKSNIQLNEVAIVAKKPMIEVKSDKLVMNVEDNINSTGYNALELLRKAPGVMVDKDENITLKGKNGTVIYVDGRPSNVQGKDLAAFLKSLQSSDIEAIEMISNPSAKYDAAGNAGIINIRLKRNRKLGTNGNVGGSAKFGNTPKYDGNLGLNYRNQKWNLYGNYSTYGGDWINKMNLNRQQDGRVFDQISQNNTTDQGHNFKVGAEYSINSKNSVGLTVNGGVGEETWRSYSNTYISNVGSAKIDSLLFATNIIPSQRNNMNYNANYRYADTSGREFNVDLNYGSFNNRSESFQPNFYKAANGVDILNATTYKNNAPVLIGIMNGKVDYEQNLWKGKFSTGIKVAQVGTDNTFDFYDVINNSEVINVERSNKFKYQEQVSAAYLSYNRTLGPNFSFQSGLRVENTISKGELMQATPGPNDIVKRNYTDFFPSASVAYTLNKNNAFNVAYSRRIDRPVYQNLNPFENKLDELSYQKGNPFLRPQYTNRVELTHSFMSFVNTSIGYSKTIDLFTEVVDTIERTKSYVSSVNINSQENLSFNINAPLPIAKWWEGFINVWVNNARFKANLDRGFNLDAAVTTFGFYSEHNITLPKGFKFQASGWFSGPSIWGGVWKTKSMGSLDLGVQKDILGGDGTIKLTVTDVFFTNNWRSTAANSQRLSMSGSGSWESRQVRVNFSYRFGNKEVKGQRNRKTGLEDESSRIKSGK